TLLRDHLARIPASCPWVFGTRWSRYTRPIDGRRILKALKRAAAAIGRPDYTFHQLRHQFATDSLTHMDPLTVKRLGRWKSNVFGRYVQLAEDRAVELQEALAVTAGARARASRPGRRLR